MPWDLLGEIAKTYGFGALIAVMALAAMGYAVKVLWSRNQELSNGASGKKLASNGKKLAAIEKQLVELHDVHLGPEARDAHGRIKWYGAVRVDEMLVRVEHLLSEIREVQTEKIDDLRDQHSIQLAALRKEFSERLTALQSARQNETAAYSRRLDELQEKRLSEMKEVVTTAVRSSTETNAAVGKISSTMETLTDVLTRR